MCMHHRVLYHITAVSGTTAARPLSSAALRQAFSYFDKDGSGRIRLVELEAALARLQMVGLDGVDATRVRDALRESNGGGNAVGGGEGAPGEDTGDWQMDLKDFARIYERSVRRFESASARQLELAFIAFDLDGDGVVTVEELREGLARIASAPLDWAKVERVLADVDADGDGAVSLSEFSRYCQQRYFESLQDVAGSQDNDPATGKR